MSSVIRVNQLNNRVGLGTITITDQGQILSGVTTASEIRTNQLSNQSGLGTITLNASGQTLSGITTANDLRTNQIRNQVGLGTITLTDTGMSLSGVTTADGPITLVQQPFYQNAQSVSLDFTIQSAYNAMSVGPIGINTGITVTISPGATWAVI